MRQRESLNKSKKYIELRCKCFPGRGNSSHFNEAIITLIKTVQMKKTKD